VAVRAAAGERQRLARQLVVAAGHLAHQARGVGPLEAVGDLDFDLGAPFADQRDVVLATTTRTRRGGPETM
jgi:hypothetical protein